MMDLQQHDAQLRWFSEMQGRTRQHEAAAIAAQIEREQVADSLLSGLSMDEKVHLSLELVRYREAKAEQAATHERFVADCASGEFD